MSKIKAYEDIAALFQTWPSSFFSRWKRNINKDELYELLERKLFEAQQREIADKFDDWSVDSVIEALVFLDSNQIKFIDESTAPPKPNKQQKKKS